MRLRSLLSACLLILTTCGVAFTQTNNGRPFRQHQTRTTLGEHDLEPPSVVRPASSTMWRNYVTVPDGPCGYPMAVQADCYNPSWRPCGPLHPVCFAKRVGRMLDCLVPCNLCCNGGGCHGCGLGGRLWGHCNMCCGNGNCGGCGGWGGAGPACGCGSCGGGCCPNPAGSVFDSVPCCTTGSHCHGCSANTYGCSDAVAPPMLSDPFRDDPLPAPLKTMTPPKPISTPATEVRRVPTNRTKPVSTPAKPHMAQAATSTAQAVASRPVVKSAPAKTAVAQSMQKQQVMPAKQSSVMVQAQTPAKSSATSAYKIVSQPARTATPPATLPANTVRKPIAAIAESEETGSVQAVSVLKRASAETAISEPAQHTINHARTQPIATMEPGGYYDMSVPSNPLR